MQLSLLVLRSEDPPALARFYGALGLSFQAERHGAGPEHLACEANGCVFEIYPATAARPRTNNVRFGFTVRDLASACRAAEQAHGRVLKAPSTGPQGLRAILKDPEGHTLELLQQAA
jgi:predicted enzyme related to lactoylglutathione lyase